jgi:hypothetical protein
VEFGVIGHWLCAPGYDTGEGLAESGALFLWRGGYRPEVWLFLAGGIGGVGDYRPGIRIFRWD